MNDAFRTAMQEPVNFGGPLSVEHLMPQQWEAHWPLPDGSKGLTRREIRKLPNDDPRVFATDARDAAVQTYGSLTILTQSLNSSISHGPWDKKRLAILDASILPLNQRLRRYTTWDEASIQGRGRELLEKALALWPPCRISTCAGAE